MSYAIVLTCRGIELTSGASNTRLGAEIDMKEMLRANPGMPASAIRIIEVVDPTIPFVHLRTDYEKLRGSTLRTLNTEIVQLNNVEIALSRDVPKVEISLAVIHVVVDALLRLSKRLDSKRL